MQIEKGGKLIYNFLQQYNFREIIMKKLYVDVKSKIYRATAITFIVQLFGALGAGFFFVIQNLFGQYHLLGATGAENEPTLWFVLFWATDFFFVITGLITAYLIAGLPAVAPSLSLGIYFAHFAGQSSDAVNFYPCFFATPANYADSTAIGYMGYLIMSVMLGLLIKYLYIGWTALKPVIGGRLDKIFSSLRKKISLIPEDLKGLTLIEGVDLIVMILIIPVASAALTFVLIKFGIQLPFGILSDRLGEILTSLSETSVIPAAIVMGLMVGFDVIGPVSLTAFSVASASYLATGNAQLLTIYSVCFITIGWTAFFGILLSKIFRKGHTDTDDMNLATSGPINAFFENIKLTNAFAMPIAMRSPFTVIPGFMAGSAVGGLLTALFGIVNTAYTDGSLPRYATENYTFGSVDYTYAQLLERGEIYMSFTLPLRSGDWLTCRIPLFLIIIGSAITGGAVIMVLKALEKKFLEKRGCLVEANGDFVLEVREFGKKLLENK